MKVYGFPGQGAQVVGMGEGLFEQFPRETRVAEDILGYSVQSLCMEDRDGKLVQTQFTQPAVYVVDTLSYLRQKSEDRTDPDFFIGHSLGEYAALFAAGVFDFETGLRLVQRRGELMSQAPRGAMAAVVGLSRTGIERALLESGVTSIDIANLNTQEQTVVAGPTDDVTRFEPEITERGGSFTLLRVSAPFHSRYMTRAAAAFESALAAVDCGRPRIPVISNVAARPYRHGHVRETLAKQIASPVDWLGSIKYLMREGIFSFVELGPGRVLTRLVREITKGTVFEQASESTGAAGTERWHSEDASLHGTEAAEL